MSDTALPAARDRLAHGPIPGVTKRLVQEIRGRSFGPGRGAIHTAFTLQA